MFPCLCACLHVCLYLFIWLCVFVNVFCLSLHTCLSGASFTGKTFPGNVNFSGWIFQGKFCTEGICQNSKTKLFLLLLLSLCRISFKYSLWFSRGHFQTEQVSAWERGIFGQMFPRGKKFSARFWNKQEIGYSLFQMKWLRKYFNPESFAIYFTVRIPNYNGITWGNFSWRRGIIYIGKFPRRDFAWRGSQISHHYFKQSEIRKNQLKVRSNIKT